MIIKWDRALLWYRLPTDGEASVAVYLDFNDWWVGVYRGPNHWYCCPLPCLVIRFEGRLPEDVQAAVRMVRAAVMTAVEQVLRGREGSSG